MSCSTCLQSKPIPICLTTLVVGEITDINTDVIVKLKNLATNKVEYIPVTSGASGEIELSNLKLMEHAYQISVAEEDEFLTEKIITIGGEVGTCVEFIVEDGEADEVQIALR